MEMYIRPFQVLSQKSNYTNEFFGSSGLVQCWFQTLSQIKAFCESYPQKYIFFTLITISEPNNALIHCKLCFMNCFVFHNLFIF